MKWKHFPHSFKKGNSSLRDREPLSAVLQKRQKHNTLENHLPTKQQKLNYREKISSVSFFRRNEIIVEIKIYNATENRTEQTCPTQLWSSNVYWFTIILKKP